MSLWRPLSSSFPSARHRSLISIRATDPCPDECRGQIRGKHETLSSGPHAGSGLGCWELTPRLHRFLSDLKYIVLGCSWSTVSADTWFSNSPKPPLPRLPALLKDMYSHSFSSHCGFFCIGRIANLGFWSPLWRTELVETSPVLLGQAGRETEGQRPGLFQIQ